MPERIKRPRRHVWRGASALFQGLTLRIIVVATTPLVAIMIGIVALHTSFQLDELHAATEDEAQLHARSVGAGVMDADDEFLRARGFRVLRAQLCSDAASAAEHHLTRGCGGEAPTEQVCPPDLVCAPTTDGRLLTHDLSAERSLIRRTVFELIVSPLVGGALLLIVTVALSVLLVQRPVEMLMRYPDDVTAFATGAGDVAPAPTTSRWSTEFVRLADAIATMQARLAQARLAEQQAIEQKEKHRERVHLMHRVATVGTMAAGIAHEIRSPLNAILVDAESMQLEETVEPYASHIIAHVARLTELTGTLLKHRGRTDKTRVPVTGGLRAVVALFGTTAQRRGITVTVTLPDDELIADMPPGEFSMSLSNLLMNALQAQGARHVAVGARREGDRVVAWVEDDGAGVPVDHRRRIFDPFFTTKEPGQAR